jgi:hypothetical protein
MIYLVPLFYIHKWELKKGKMELIIDVPENIDEIIKGYVCVTSKIGFEGLLSKEILINRSKIFSHKLMEEVL